MGLALKTRSKMPIIMRSVATGLYGAPGGVAPGGRIGGEKWECPEVYDNRTSARILI